MSNELAVMDITKKDGQFYLYFQSPFCEDLFKRMSEEHYGSAKFETVFTADGRSKLYDFYKVRALPTTPYTLAKSWDILNYYAWMRAEGVGKGLKMRSPIPVLGRLADKLAERVEQNLIALSDQLGASNQESKIRRFQFITEA